MLKQVQNELNLVESVNKDWKDLYPEISDPIKIIYT